MTTPSQTRAEIYKFIRETPVVQSLLYDLDLLPEQHEENTPDDERMLCVVGHFKHALAELAASEERIKTLRDEVLEECAKKCEQQMLTGWANEKGDCDEHNEGCRFSAEAIRALKAAPPQPEAIEQQKTPFGFTPGQHIESALKWLDSRRERLHHEGCSVHAPSARCNCGLHKCLTDLRAVQNAFPTAFAMPADEGK